MARMRECGKPAMVSAFEMGFVISLACGRPGIKRSSLTRTPSLNTLVGPWSDAPCAGAVEVCRVYWGNKGPCSVDYIYGSRLSACLSAGCSVNTRDETTTTESDDGDDTPSCHRR